MSAPHQASPLQLDEYRVVAELAGRGEVTLSVGRRDADGGAVVLMAPSAELAADAAYRLRFWAEANKSRRLTSRWTAPVTGVADPESLLPWVAYDCLPALPLPKALSEFGSPFPELVVSSIGVSLAEALLITHSNGLVHAGISPETVLLTPHGPRLTGYGLVRAASSAGNERPTVPGIAPESLPPEQRSGGEPRPLGDIYALGSVLAYAATGRRVATPAELPSALRDIITACLSPDPVHRPRADALVQSFRERQVSTAAELPVAVLSALGSQANAYVPPQPSADTALLSAVDETAIRPATPAAAPARRTVITGATAAAIGVAAGVAGVAVWRSANEPDARPRPPRVAKGTAPAPLWRFQASGGGKPSHVVPTGRRTAVLVMDAGVLGLDLHNGKQLWSRDDVLPAGPPIPAGNGEFVLPELNEFSLISSTTGRLKWREKGYGTQKRRVMSMVLAGQDGVIWFMAEDTQETDENKKKMVVAYRLRDRKELWRTAVPPTLVNDLASPDVGEVRSVVLGKVLLLPNNSFEAKGEYHSYLALDLRNGRKSWEQEYRQVPRQAFNLLQPVSGDLLVSGVRENVNGIDLKTGKKRWSIATRTVVTTESVVRGDTLYVLDARPVTYAIDLRRGKTKWTRAALGSPSLGAVSGKVALSHSGGTVLTSTGSEIDALNAANGAPRWRFATVGEGDEAGEPGAVVASLAGLVVVANGPTLYALPVD